MGRELYFPTPVYFTDLPSAQGLNAVLLERICAWRERDPHGTMRSNVAQVGAWHSSTDMQVHPEFDCLTREIFELVQGVYDDQGYSGDYEPVCDSMWANINPRYAYNRHHTHPHALWSGVYYVQTPDNCGLLCLADPRPQAQVLTPYYDPQRKPADSASEVYYQPVTGRVILFPAWLVHAVQPNLTGVEGPEGNRISVSFNFHQRRCGISGGDSRRMEVVRADLLARAAP